MVHSTVSKDDVHIVGWSRTAFLECLWLAQLCCWDILFKYSAKLVCYFCSLIAAHAATTTTLVWLLDAMLTKSICLYARLRWMRSVCVGMPGIYITYISMHTHKYIHISVPICVCRREISCNDRQRLCHYDRLSWLALAISSRLKVSRVVHIYIQYIRCHLFYYRGTISISKSWMKCAQNAANYERIIMSSFFVFFITYKIKIIKNKSHSRYWDKYDLDSKLFVYKSWLSLSRLMIMK